jgi:hypothetical protein
MRVRVAGDWCIILGWDRKSRRAAGPKRSSDPPLGEMIARLREVYADLPGPYDRAGDRRGTPNPYEPGRAAFPTAGEFAAYLMTGHLGYHLGQLQGWRVAARMR